MKLRDIDLHDIKVAVFDFDDTLAVHKDKNFSEHRNKTEEDKIDFMRMLIRSRSVFMMR